MTTKPVITRTPGAADIIQFPDRPDSFDMTTYRNLTIHGIQAALIAHFDNRDTTIINSEVAAGVRPTKSYDGVLFPDLLIAFDADPAADAANNGYAISVQGKPPDFVLEIGSKTTGERDEIYKRQAYAAMGIPEYWRFDETGGQYHRAPLAGDRLVNGVYQPIPIHRAADGHLWGHSAVLNLDLCWENGTLRFRDPATGLYLPTLDQERTGRLQERAGRLRSEARADAAEARADTEAEARRAAEERAAAAEARAEAEAARARQLETELRRRQNP